MPTFVTSDGLRLYYEDTHGEGMPILCLSGLTRNVRDFDYVKPHLAAHRVVAMDYRGRGQSEFDPDYSNYNVLREGQDAIELLDHLGIDRCVLLGTSRGGLIAMALAAQHCDRLAGVILNDVGPVLDLSGLGRIMAYVGKRPAQATHAQMAAHLQTSMGAQFPNVADARWLQEAQHHYIEAPDGLHLRYDAALLTALTEQATAGDAPDLGAWFDQLAALPVGVIRGANSDILTVEGVAEMHRRHPRLIAADVPERGHVPFLDEPEALEIIHQITEVSI